MAEDPAASEKNKYVLLLPDPRMNVVGGATRPAVIR
jgi:hypothetical protein